MKQELIDEIHNILSETESDDENIGRLEKAMEYFSGNYDICEGYKYAIELTLNDQVDHHFDELEVEDLVKLKAILTK